MLGTNVTTYPTAGAQLSLEMENRNAIRATVSMSIVSVCVRACVRACVCVWARVRACVCVCVVCVVCCCALPILSQQQCAPCTQNPIGVTGVMKPPTSQIGKSKIASEIDKYIRLTQLAVRLLLQYSFKLVEQCSTCLKASQQMKPLSFFKTPSSFI